MSRRMSELCAVDLGLSNCLLVMSINAFTCRSIRVCVDVGFEGGSLGTRTSCFWKLESSVWLHLSAISVSTRRIEFFHCSSTTCVAVIRIKMSLFVCLLFSTVNKIWVSMIYRSLTFYSHFTHQPNIWKWGCAFSTYVVERLQWWSNKEDKLNTEVHLCVFLSKAVQ